MSLDQLLQRAGASNARLLLAGGDTNRFPRVQERLHQAGHTHSQVVGASAPSPGGHPRLGDVATNLRQQKPERVHDGIHALDLAADPIRFAAGLAALGEADAVVVGPGVTPAELADTAAWTHGPPPDGGLVHSATWLLSADHGLLALADCSHAGTLAPDLRARLALLVARAHEGVSGATPQVAFLAGPEGLDGDEAAEAALAALAGYDSGLVARVDRLVGFRGSGNVLIFPCGTSAHLASRFGRALGSAALLGPLIMGPRGVMATVVEDATEDEIVGTAALAVLLAGRPNN